ncbi:hypothetical protein D0Y83_08500 [Qipengyuania flava]|uniref:Uncharacterized protein n=1 Tax=Qipengyuania flava TaxID=192812 RepID=A0A5P6NDN3_9SPHN|nr:hypothetical protein [Erythrobacter sp.]QFI63303.1 hypothetical protein D0Y83_08500 [Qipengyuania flava]|tara:strand:- start:341 stop:562 length:222 start_codon:yes stop_codon:yes gene_type:complete
MVDKHYQRAESEIIGLQAPITRIVIAVPGWTADIWHHASKYLLLARKRTAFCRQGNLTKQTVPFLKVQPGSLD